MKTSMKIALSLLFLVMPLLAQQPDNIFKKNKNGDLPVTRLAVTKNLTDQSQILKQINIFRLEDGLTPINPDKANEFFANTMPQNIYENADSKIIKANVNVPIERLPGFVGGEKYNLWQNLDVVKTSVSNAVITNFFQTVLDKFQLPANIKKQLDEQFLSGKFEEDKLLPGSVLEQVVFISPPYTCPAPLKNSEKIGTGDEPNTLMYHKTIYLPFIGDDDLEYFSKQTLGFQFVSTSDDKFLYVIGIVRRLYENTSDWTGALNIFWYKIAVADLPNQVAKKIETAQPKVIKETEIVADAESQLVATQVKTDENLIILEEEELKDFVKKNYDNILQVSLDTVHDLDRKLFLRVKEVALASHLELGFVIRIENAPEIYNNSHLPSISAFILKDEKRVLISNVLNKVETPSESKSNSSKNQVRILNEQITILKKFFPELKNATFDTSIAKNLPQNAEGWFALPKWEKLGKNYPSAVNRVLSAIGATRSFSKTKTLCWDNLSQCIKTAEMLQKLDKGYDFYIIPCQFGYRRHDLSAVNNCESISTDEFVLGMFAIGCMILTHPERMQNNDARPIYCAGDEFIPEISKVGRDGYCELCGDAPVFQSFGSHKYNYIVLDYAAFRSNGHKAEFGVPTGFLPQ